MPHGRGTGAVTQPELTVFLTVSKEHILQGRAKKSVSTSPLLLYQVHGKRKVLFFFFPAQGEVDAVHVAGEGCCFFDVRQFKHAGGHTLEAG